MTYQQTFRTKAMTVRRDARAQLKALREVRVRRKQAATGVELSAQTGPLAVAQPHLPQPEVAEGAQSLPDESLTRSLDVAQQGGESCHHSDATNVLRLADDDVGADEVRPPVGDDAISLASDPRDDLQQISDGQNADGQIIESEDVFADADPCHDASSLDASLNSVGPDDAAAFAGITDAAAPAVTNLGDSAFAEDTHLPYQTGCGNAFPVSDDPVDGLDTEQDTPVECVVLPQETFARAIASNLLTSGPADACVIDAVERLALAELAAEMDAPATAEPEAVMEMTTGLPDLDDAPAAPLFRSHRSAPRRDEAPDGGLPQPEDVRVAEAGPTVGDLTVLGDASPDIGIDRLGTQADVVSDILDDAAVIADTMASQAKGIGGFGETAGVSAETTTLSDDEDADCIAAAQTQDVDTQTEQTLNRSQDLDNIDGSIVQDANVDQKPPQGQAAETRDLQSLPGIGPGLIWILMQTGISDLDDLAAAEEQQLARQLGPVGEILDVAHLIRSAGGTGGAI